MLNEQADVDVAAGSPSHRASYRLEMGIWKATCKICGWEVTDPVRRQAATSFRQHIVAARNGQPTPIGIDLRDASAIVDDALVVHN